MKKQLISLKTLALALGTLALTVSCSDDDSSGAGAPTETKADSDRWITIAGARMGEEAGDGNGGTFIYSLSSENAKNPNVKVETFDYGFAAPSNRTARLQASEDGNTIFNISYAGDTGGVYSKYVVNGGQNFTPVGLPMSITQYVGTAPRWIKLFDGDQTGAAVYVSTENIIDDKGTDDVTDDEYIKTESTIDVLTIDLQNSGVNKFVSQKIALTPEQEAKGYYISRIDMPVLNTAGDKLYIGARMSNLDTSTLESDSGYEILEAKTIVVDYPSLENATIISSGIGFGNTNGYRSINAFEYNGAVYQANQGDPNGSHILKIGADNQYDDSYDFNLDNALGVTGAYVLAWRPAANGKAVLAYRHDGSAEGVAGRGESYFALVDLDAKTATKITEVPYDVDMEMFQYQGFAVDGNEIYFTAASVGKDGNIYVIDTETGNVTKGAQLINAEGSHFIGAW